MTFFQSLIRDLYNPKSFAAPDHFDPSDLDFLNPDPSSNKPPCHESFKISHIFPIKTHLMATPIQHPVNSANTEVSLYLFFEFVVDPIFAHGALPLKYHVFVIEFPHLQAFCK